MKKLVSVVIRTLNEEKYLKELLLSVKNQCTDKYNIEVVIVDSGSTDNTLNISKEFDARITYIKKSEFTFGRSLNIGCEFANGDFLVFISGHCIPKHTKWIENLISPLETTCVYTYGKQVARDTTKFSEAALFEKYFPAESRIPQEGFFCNNANSAIKKEIWNQFKFDEKITGCEDMYLAKQLTDKEYKVGYVADAEVYHIHDETWERVQIRYEREAVALHKIMPEISVSILDTLQYIITGIIKDCKLALLEKTLMKEVYSIIRFRYAQYVGAYKGNKINRELSNKLKEKYFYPRVTDIDLTNKIEK